VEDQSAEEVVEEKEITLQAKQSNKQSFQT
jgi:hypothetical protein